MPLGTNTLEIELECPHCQNVEIWELDLNSIDSRAYRCPRCKARFLPSDSLLVEILSRREQLAAFLTSCNGAN